MTRFGWTVVLSVLLVLAVLASAGYYLHKRSVGIRAPVVVTPDIATSTDPTSLELYSNGDYGFSLAYPKGTLVSSASASTTSKKGAEVTPVQINLGDAGLSVRVATGSTNVQACTKLRPSEVSASTTTFGGATWHIYSRDELGTDTQMHDTSYRTVHENSCVTLFAQQPYIEGVTMVRQDLAAIVESFSFARP